MYKTPPWGFYNQLKVYYNYNLFNFIGFEKTSRYWSVQFISVFYWSLTQHTGNTFMGNGPKRAELKDRKRACGPCKAAIAGSVFSMQNREQYSTFDPIVMEQLRSDSSVDYGPLSYGIHHMPDPTNIILALESQVRMLNKCF